MPLCASTEFMARTGPRNPAYVECESLVAYIEAVARLTRVPGAAKFIRQKPKEPGGKWPADKPPLKSKPEASVLKEFGGRDQPVDDLGRTEHARHARAGVGSGAGQVKPFDAFGAVVEAEPGALGEMRRDGKAAALMAEIVLFEIRPG